MNPAGPSPSHGRTAASAPLPARPEFQRVFYRRWWRCC